MCLSEEIRQQSVNCKKTETPPLPGQWKILTLLKLLSSSPLSPVGRFAAIRESRFGKKNRRIGSVLTFARIGVGQLPKDLAKFFSGGCQVVLCSADDTDEVKR